MSSRSFTVFQDVPTSEAVRAKPAAANIMATRSSARLNRSLQGSSTLGNVIPMDKENVHPVTGERAGATGTSKKRKTNVLTTKSTPALTIKKAKSSKDTEDAQPDRKKRKAVSGSSKPKAAPKKDGKQTNSSRKTTTKRVTRKVSQLPRLEEEAEVKGQDAERITQATIDSRCYELTVQPLADVSQAYDTIEPTQEEASPAGKIKFCKDASAEPEIRDFFSSSQTLLSMPSSSTLHATPTKSAESRKFSTPERKQIYAAFTFSTPSSSSERLTTSRSGSVPRLEFA